MENKEVQRGFAGLCDLVSDTSTKVEKAIQHKDSEKSDAFIGSAIAESSPEAKPRSTQKSFQSPLNNGKHEKTELLGVSSFFIVVIVVFVVLLISISRHHIKSEQNYDKDLSATQDGEFKSEADLLFSKIEENKKTALLMESEITELDKRINYYLDRLKHFESVQQLEAYNNIVDDYNGLIEKRKQFYEQYSALVDLINEDVNRFNSTYR